MLQEILLSLSGHRSPLWEQVRDDDGSTDGSESLRNYLAPSEKALLAPLAHLSDLHIRIRDHAAEISSSHPSVICRSVASSISSSDLSKFRRKILEVEKSILIQDAGYVGAYGIVPLSTVVAEFAPWVRRLEWLWQLADYMLPPTGNDQQRRVKCTGAEVIDYLERETYTGYTDLEEMASNLLESAQRTWMRQVAIWVLYGKLPTHGSEDFCIEDTGTRSAADGRTFAVRSTLVPKFVSSNSATSMLSVGESLQQICSQTSPFSKAANDSVVGLLPTSLAHLNKLTYPISAASFASMITAIRLSISQNALSQLLPLPKVLEILDVIQEFLLLGRGEFAIALINNADSRIAKRSLEVAKPVRKAGRLDDLNIKEAEVSAVLSQTFADLASLQNDHEEEDETLERGRAALRLVVKVSQPDAEAVGYTSTLFPTPTSLELHLPKDSALNLFLNKADLNMYATINAYLLSLRRAELHLSALWKITPLRRCHPRPLGPPASARPAGQKLLATQRTREGKRSALMRRHWATVSKALFVLNELGTYFQGEVIQDSWEHFRKWIDQEGTARPRSSDSSKQGSRPGTASSTASKHLKTSQLSNAIASTNGAQGLPTRNDPIALAKAHRTYLRNLTDSLLLSRKDFMNALKHVFTTVDHFIALFTRLQSAWQGLDLQEDDGVVDALSDFVKEEREVIDEMARTGKLLEEGLSTLVKEVASKEQTGNGEDVKEIEDGVDTLGLDSIYVPRRTRTIERLIMKLDMPEGAQVMNDDGKMYDDD